VQARVQESGGRDCLNSKKGFLSDKLLFFKTLAATLLPVSNNQPTSIKMLAFKQKSMAGYTDRRYEILYIYMICAKVSL